MQIPIGFALFFEAFIGFKRMFVEGFCQKKYTFGCKKCPPRSVKGIFRKRQAYHTHLGPWTTTPPFCRWRCNECRRGGG